MLVDADGQETDDIFVDPGLALEFQNNAAWCIETQHDIMCLAVLLDLVGERTQAPGFGQNDLSFIGFNNFGGFLRKSINLRLAQILSRKEDMLIHWHAIIPSFTADR